MDDQRRSEDSMDDGQEPTKDQPALAAANEALAQMRLSIDSPRSPSPAQVNGIHSKTNGSAENLSRGSGNDTVQTLKEELLKQKQDYDALTSKYNTLVGKLSAMRSSVESKLKSDAVRVIIFIVI